MKRFLGVLVLCVGIFVGVSAYADCASNEFAYTDPNTNTTTCITSKFQVTTTALEADDDFYFSMGAAGTFYVDWGDGTVEKIERADADYGETYDHVYENSGTYNIQFGGLATDYYVESGEGYYYQPAAISFSGNYLVASVSGSLSALFPVINGSSPSFESTFQSCSNLTSVAGNMFSGLGTTPRMFYYTFAESGITSIPQGLFAGIVGSTQPDLFNMTFYACSDLTGAIPSGLFPAGITGAPAANMFNYTFGENYNMPCSIPADLFSGISGAVGGTDSYGYTNGENTWSGTFYYFCSNASSTTFIPSTLFANITGDIGSVSTFSGVFDGSGLATSCPTGYHRWATVAENYFDGHVSCVADSVAVQTFAITLNDNGGSGGSGTVYERFDSDWSLSQNGSAITSVAVPTRSGYAFSGYWTETSSGTRVIGSDGALPDNTYFINDGTLYAQWVPVYTITLNDNGGSGGSGAVYERYGVGWSFAVDGNAVTSVSIPTHPDGLVFNGYWTATTGGTMVINSNGRLPSNTYFNSDQILYAQWIGQRYTITLNDNGGSGGSGTVYERYGVDWSFAVNGSAVTSVSIPTHPGGLTFNGYWTAAVNGVRVIGSNGVLPSPHLTNQTLYAQWIEQSSSVFWIETTNLSAGARFEFGMTAAGTFYVDWGDGTVDTITRSNVSFLKYSHTYTEPGVYNIGFSGRATNYSGGPQDMSIMFGLSGSDNSRTVNARNFIGKIYGSLGAIFPTIGSKSPVFLDTFRGCSNLTGRIPADLFGGITKPVEGMFMRTFSGCSGLTGEIPASLFADLDGNIQMNMFNSTFVGCSGLTGEIPSGLFGNIRGPMQDAAFPATFSNCTNLSCKIPSNLFASFTGTASGTSFYRTFYNFCSNHADQHAFVPVDLFDSTRMTNGGGLSGIFQDSGLSRSCPCGTHQYITGFESSWSGRVACEVGLKDGTNGTPIEHWYNGHCSVECGAGFTRLKTSTGLSFVALAENVSAPSPALHVRNDANGMICYIPVEQGTGSFNVTKEIGNNTVVYHAVNPDDTPPVGFTGQP
ncbi:MAG: InlB B-repeat-containing protein [Alphaproteobacteria bacterium]|nr:InlB B-repeat-containing protein [Alphaproteobacteria bacterium]